MEKRSEERLKKNAEGREYRLNIKVETDCRVRSVRKRAIFVSACVRINYAAANTARLQRIAVGLGARPY